MRKSTRRYIQFRTEVISGMALLALAGTPSLRADLRGDLWSEFNAGSMAEALPMIEESKKSGQAAGWYFSGMKAMLDFDFDKAQKEFAEYKRVAKKNGTTTYNEAVEEALHGLNEGRLQFDRFQNIVVIDAIEVDRDDFFKHLRLPLSAGRIVAAPEIVKNKNGCGETAYISESGDLIMWSEDSVDAAGEDNSDVSDEEVVMMEADVLADGSISEPRKIEELGIYPDFPFLTADGSTLYYSAEGNNSVGGRDIFIASRDPQTGEYRTPVNAGFPYNSAADDYLLAIDEENGVGWWATDRHVLPGNKIMLYVFMLPDGRKNFEGEDDDKRARGILSDVRVTWFSPESESIEDDENDDEDTSPAEISEEDKLAQQRARERSYIEKAAEIKKIKPGQHARRKECMIPVAPGRYIYSPEEATNAQEKALIENYINAEKEYSTLKNELDKLRREYSSSPGKALGEKILEMENAEVKMRNSLTQILSQFYQQYKKNGR